MRVHIAHANGFPSQVYEPLAQRLNAEVFALPKVGHNATFPVTSEWDALVDELIAHISACSLEKNGPTNTAAGEKASGKKVFLVGHSLGAILSFRVAHARPDLVSGLVMLDPPLIYGVSAWPVRLARLIGKVDDFTPARLSKHRRRQWDSWESVESYFEKKAFFKQLHPEAYAAWLKYGVVENEHGFHLAFSVETEVEIFRTTPLYLNHFSGRLQIPAWLLYAKDSDASWRHCVEPFARKFGLRVQLTQGGHMFPLIDLNGTAAFINRCMGEALREPEGRVSENVVYMD